MSEQTIQSVDIKIADVFQAFYVVPDYQREYVWQTEEVELLLNDINSELNGADPAKAPEYFIGSIVVCPGKNGVFDLIDGQQRMTTLFLTLCAIRDRLKELNEKPPGALDPQIAATSTDALGNDQFRYRMELQYEDSGDVLVSIAKGPPYTPANKQTRSVDNIRNAYSVAMGFLTQQFSNNIPGLRTFYGYFTNKVKLIRIQTEDVAKALKIFETINDRGVGLDSMDLLKNLLFMKADTIQFEKLKTVWKDLQDTIYAAGEKPLRFLRYFIFSRFDVDTLREDEIYGWFSKNENVCGYSAAPLKFAGELLGAAQACRYFLHGCDVQGRERPHLKSLQFLGGKAARQHLILLLAGRHLPDVLFDKLTREVENLFFTFVVTREPTRNFERSFARWAPELRKVTNDNELTVLVQKRLSPVRVELATRFGDAFRNMYTWSVQLYRLRYILGKLTQHVQIEAYGETEGTKWLRHYTDNEYQIEHIHPQVPDTAAQFEFGPIKDKHASAKLGNLALVEKSINASLGNKPFSHKRKIYPQSKLLLTHAIAERPKIGTNTSIDRAVHRFEPYAAWNEAAIAARQTTLIEMARVIWDVPAIPEEVVTS